jgi:hypothetical protein
MVNAECSPPSSTTRNLKLTETRRIPQTIPSLVRLRGRRGLQGTRVDGGAAAA